MLDVAPLNFDENFIIGLPEIDKQDKLIMISYNTIPLYSFREISNIALYPQ